MRKSLKKIIILITFFMALDVSFAENNCTSFFQSELLSKIRALHLEIKDLNSIQDLETLKSEFNQLQIITETRIQNIKNQDILAYAEVFNQRLNYSDVHSLEYMFKRIFYYNDLGMLMYMYHEHLNDSQKQVLSDFVKTWPKSQNQLEKTGYDAILTAFIFNSNFGINVKYQQKLLPFILDINAPNSRGDTALTASAAHEAEGSILLLLEHGANPNQRNLHGLLPLQLAYLFANTKAIQILTEHGAEIDVNNDSKKLAQPILTQVIQNLGGNITALKLILALSPDINYQDPTFDNRTALMTAIHRHYYEAALELMKHSPDLSLKDSHGYTVFDYAKDAPEYLELLRGSN